MATRTFPGNLIPFHRHDGRFAKQQAASGGLTLLDRDELLERLGVLGEVAPGAPLSFLVVQLFTRGDECATESVVRHRLIETLALRASVLLRPMDAIGRWTTTSLGVALQGSGATASAAVAARLSLHLNELLQAYAPGIEARVYTATGNGLNARTLPAAAIEDIGECC